MKPKKILLILTLILISFIPLWPKLPLFQPIPNYIVRVRLEDLFVFISLIIFALAYFKKRVTLKTPLNKYLLIYFSIGLISLLVNIFLSKQIPLVKNHILKAFLHLFRYLEYLFLFFLSFNAIKTKQQKLLFIKILVGVVVLASIYGFGQRYFKWSVYSTMNWEYSQGIALELASLNSRVPSTFAGHYDFAIYLSFLLPIFYSYYLKEKRWWLLLGMITGLWALFAASLRSAFLGFAGAIFLVNLFYKKNLIKNLIISFGVILIFFILFGTNLQTLFHHSFLATNNNSQRSIEEAIISQYQPPIPKDKELAKKYSNYIPQELSDCAREKELSVCVRLESLWPAALRGFMANPLLGTGFGTLNKPDKLTLAPADGIDNNYLRILGETGLLGLLAFLFLIFQIIKLCWRQRGEDPLIIGYLAGLASLLVCVLLFDVFAASKLAFTFWAVTGATFPSAQKRHSAVLEL